MRNRNESAIDVDQCGSRGGSCPDIHAAALEAAAPRPGLSWVDIGCGTGAMLRSIRDRFEPERLIGVDVFDWLDDDLREDVDFRLGSASSELSRVDHADRVLLVEALEHLDDPWSTLAAAASRVAPGGLIVVTTPNITSLRHRLELLVRAQLTSFRPDNRAHLTPALPHVIARVLERSGLATSGSYAGRDIVPLTGGRPWPVSCVAMAPRLLSVSSIVVGRAA
jgi:2-polyprenyl-3-methyl-5-hydroxy-6-metoxy-1,4-benzoquinol methylase